MKRILVLLLLTLMLPLASASTYIGWLGVGEKISYGDNTIEIEDIGVDGKVLLVLVTEGKMRYISLKPGEKAVVNNISVKVERVFLTNEPMAYLNITFPPILVNQSIVIGKYIMKVKDVTADSVKIAINGKVYTAPSSIKLDNYEISISPRPVIFSDWLKVGESFTYEDYVIKVVGSTTISVGNESRDALILKFGKKFATKKFIIPEGESALMGPFIVKVVRSICEIRNYACNLVAYLNIMLRGVNVSVLYDPSRIVWVYEGKGFVVGPMIVTLEGVTGNLGYVSIMNNCWDRLKSGTLRANPFVIQGIGYDGLMTGILEIGSDSKGKKAKFIVFYNEEKEKPRYLAFLNVTIEAPTTATLFVPFNVTVRIKNEGLSKVFGIILTFKSSEHVKLIGRNRVCIDSLDPGKSVEFKFTLVPLRRGNVNVGRAIVKAPIPYPLACGGLTLVTFYSNSPIVQIAPANFTILLDYNKTATVGIPFDVDISIFEPFYGNVTLKLPPSMGLLYHGELLQGNVVIPARNESLKLVAVTPGNYTIPVILSSNGIELSRENIKIKVVGKKCQASIVTITRTKNVGNFTETVTQTIERTLSKVTTKTITKTTTTTVEKKSWSLVPFLIGFVAGVGIIMLIAWIMARSS
ncbi:hypothetical protein PNA2_1187 [Pyrococcus sp. NA2]|uniref:hypothetical protein n=1 Tax=Pyrococcus sp. (strain NA2) TaxID=342949 RepID=UPI000209ABE1|nr:hypothetical protein [Pyrococcus sp. NA2]AEC52101.1 hypothetical protein PNA2_1187 [Pyrococcus sp. NA2]